MGAGLGSTKAMDWESLDPPSKCPGLINIIEKIDSRDIGRERINISNRQVPFFRAEKEGDLMGVNLALELPFTRGL